MNRICLCWYGVRGPRICSFHVIMEFFLVDAWYRPCYAMIVIDNIVDVLAELKPKYKGKLTLPRIQGSLLRLQAPLAVLV
mgnify:CR=1 FL=1